MNNLPVKKVFKNLSDLKFDRKKSDAVEASTTQTSIPMQQTVSFLFEIDNKNLIIIVLTLLALLTLSASLIKKYRQRMFSNFTDAIPQMDDTLLDFSGHWKDGEWATDQQTIEEVNQQIQNTEAKTVK